LEQFFVRKRDALQAGECAWREGTIKAHHQKLYERLVDAVGAHAYCWVKVETLAGEFGVDDSTIKRWLATLDRANLIRRQRQYGVSSRTYITAYDQRVSTTETEQAAIDDTTDEAEDEHDATAHADEDTDEAATPGGDGGATVGHDGSFFEREAAPSNSAFLHRHIKEVPFNPSVNGSGRGGGKESPFDITVIDPEQRAIIDDEGVNTDEGRRIIAAQPHDELRAIQGYLDRQQNVRDRAGLLVWLARRRFGAELLAGRARAQGTRQCLPTKQQTAQSLLTLTGDDAPQHDNPETDACGYSAPPSQDNLGGSGTLPSQHARTALWRTVTTQLMVPPLAWSTWIAPTRLLVLDEDHAIIGTPNIFVRDEVTDVYRPQLETVLSTCVGHPVRIEVVIARETEDRA
jgi:predicted transcriptional regulator